MAKLKELLGKRIKELRIAKNLTQEQLAELVGIGSASLSKIEIGMNHPTEDNLEKIAKALGVETYKLYMFNHHKDTKELKADIIARIENANNDEIQLAYRVLNGLLD